nr:phage portal protein [Companilactobacillus mishanensis]
MWSDDLITNNVIPNYRNSTVGIGALSNSDVLTAVSIVAGDVARFPIMEINDEDDSIVDDDDVTYLLNKKSSEFVSAYTWKFAMMVNAILTGNSYSRIKRDPRTRGPQAKKPLEFEFFAPSQTELIEQRTSAGMNYKYRFTPLNGEDTIECNAEDVIHWKFFTTDTILGRSPLLSLGQEINLQESGVDTLSKFFKSGLKSAVLKVPGSRLNKQARKKIREDFEYAQSNNGNAPIIVDSTMDYTPIEVDTNVLNLINSNNWSTSQIAKAMRIPAFKLGVNSPNQSVKQLQEGYVKYDLPFYFQPLINEFQMKLLSDDDRHKYHFEFDVRKETGMAMQDVVTAIQNDILTPNDGRGEIGKKPDKTNPDMDRYQSTLNSVFLDKKEEYQESTKGGMNSDSQTGSTVNTDNG